MHVRVRSGRFGLAFCVLLLAVVALVLLGGRPSSHGAAAQSVDAAVPSEGLQQEPGDGEFRLVPVQQIGGASHAIVTQHDTAYLGLGPRLVSADVSGEEPTFWGQTDVLPGVVQALAVHGGHIYAAYQAGAAADRRSGVAAVLVSDPATPVIDSTVSREVGYAGIAAEAGVVVAVGSFDNWFEQHGVVDVYDSSDPTALRLASTVSLQGRVTAVAMHGHRAYVLEERPSGRSTVVRVLDVSDPDHVTKETVASVLGHPTSIVTDGIYLFVAGGDEAISILEADPLGLGLVGRLPLEPHDACASTLMLLDETLYVGDQCSGALHMVGVSNPLSPRLYDTLDLGVLPGAIAPGTYWEPHGRYLHVASGPAGGMLTVNVEPGGTTRVVGELRTLGAAERLEVVDGELYTVHRDVGLTATDLEGGRVQGAALAATWPLADARDVLSSHDHLYVAGGDEHVLHVLPQRPQIGDEGYPPGYWRVAIDGDPAQLLAADGTLFVAAGSGGVRSLDLSDPERPVEVGHYGPHSAYQMARSGDVLYMGGGLQWVFLLDASDPAQLRELGKVRANANVRVARAIAADGDWAYIPLSGLDPITQEVDTSLDVVDASDPTSPQRAKTHYDFAPVLPRQATVDGGELFVAGIGGLSVVRLPAAEEAVVLADWSSPGMSTDVRVYKDGRGGETVRHAYVADGDGGVQVFAIEEPGRPPFTPEPTGTPPERVPTQEPTPVETWPAPNWPTSLYLPMASKGAKLPPDSVEMSFSGSVGGASLKLHVAWPHVYRGDGPHLVTYDVSDPEAIHEVGRSEVLPDAVTDVTVVGDVAYVAASESGLLVLDLSDPEYATLMSRTRTPDSALDVAAVGGFVLVAARDAGLLAFDVTNPRVPVLVDRLQLPVNAFLVRSFGEHAIAQAGGETHVISVAGDGSLDKAAELVDEECSGGTEGLALDGSRAYVGQCGLEIAVYDLSDAQFPVHLGTTRFAETNTHVMAAGGGVVFAVAGPPDQFDLHVINASDPASLQLVGDVELMGMAIDIALVDGHGHDTPHQHVVIGTSTGFADSRGDAALQVRGALHVVDASAADDPRVIGTNWLHASPILGAEPVGQYLYARIREPEGTMWGPVLSRVALIDASDPGHPTMKGLLDEPADAYDLAVRGDMAYVGTTDGWFEVYYAEVATEPVRTARYQMAQVPVTVAVQDSGPVFAAYVEYDAEYKGTITLCVVDVSEPRNPSVVSRVQLPGSLVAMAAADGHAYLSVTQDLERRLVDIDATSPAAANVVSSTTFPQNPWIAAIAARGDRVFAALAHQGVALLDMSDRSAPRIVGATDTSVEANSDGLQWTEDDRLVVAGGGGVELFDVAIPTRPVALDHEAAPPYVTVGPILALWPTVANGHVYVTYGTELYEDYLGLAAIRME